MSRNVADYLFEELQFDEEYRKNFSDKIVEVDENQVEKENYLLQEEIKKQMKKEEEFQKCHDMFLEMKGDLQEFNLCSKMNFFHFLKLIKRTDLYKLN